ncbi:MAG: hypothetical protein D6714_14000 [Bacteroidetes bacterium]|nr:MAG: hypothetical protein D6714_14000 [Bacteroidota bacterium]
MNANPFSTLLLGLTCFFIFPNTSLLTQNLSRVDSAFADVLEYRCIGPTRGGRVTAVAGVRQSPSEFYMGSTGGGVWKTDDYGQNWKNVSDGYFATPSIGAIRVAPSDPDVVYVGTGSDGIRSNVIVGKGVYKTTDGAKTWQWVGLEKTGQIGALEIHPDNPDIVFVAAIGQPFQPNPERGIYRTTDGGKNWQKVLFLSDTTGFSDLEMAPGNPDILYAGAWRAERKPWTIISGGREGGIYKSEDGGDTWTRLSNGLPGGLIGKIDLAVSPADPARVYALVEAPKGEGGLYMSKNYGQNWTLVSTHAPLLDRPFYYCNVDADPVNPEKVFVSATQFWVSEDGGKNWSRRRTPHGDNHDLWINPDHPEVFIQANDGGANVTLNGGKSWSTQWNQPTAELYQVETDDQVPFRLYAGQQDNTTLSLPVLPEKNAPVLPVSLWESVGGCETGPAVPKPGNPNIVYSNCKGRFGVYNRLTGQEKQYYVGAGNMYGHNPKDLKFRFQRVSPIHVSRHNPNVIYHASQYLHKTTDEGEHWEIISPDLTAFSPETQTISGSPITRDITGEEFYSTIYAVRESPLKEGLIWVGANDGPVHMTPDGGQTWQNVTPPTLPPGGRIDCVEPSPHRENKAYFTALRYQLGDWRPYVFKTEDLGKTWTLLTDGTNGIPADYPVRVVREDPDRAGLLYAGTEFGMFISFDDGAHWAPFQLNLPVTPITDLQVHEKDLVVSTMGRSFWVLDDLSPLHQWTPQPPNSVQLFRPRDTYRLRYVGSRGPGIPQYPPHAARIDYYLPADLSDPLVLEILDEKGNVVRSFNSEKPVKDSLSTSPDMATGFYFEGYSPQLKKTKGFHRFRWDLRHTGAWDKDRARSGRNGPMVSPGAYMVRLKAGSEVASKSFWIHIQPKIEASGVSVDDLKAQEALSLKIRDLYSEAKQLAFKVDLQKKALEKVQNLNLPATTNLDQIVAIENELVTRKGRYPQPMLIDQIRYLASMLDRADQRPGQDAYDRYEELKAWLESVKKMVK